MIVLDTNVVSALMRPVVDESVALWIDALPEESIWSTSITVFEIRAGMELLGLGRRRRQLEDALDSMLDIELGGRVLDFDTAAANAAARIAVELRRRGRSTETRDVQIAGIAASRKATLATRNTKHFEGIKLAIVNPWSTAGSG